LFGVVPFLFGVVNNITTWTLFTCIFNCFGNPPIWSYLIWVTGGIATLIQLKTKNGRLGLFQSYRKNNGGGLENPHWMAMTGVWTWKYQDVSKICKEFQARKPFFGNNQAAVPSVWPPGVSEAVTDNSGGFLLWTYGQKHTAYRRAFHSSVIGQFDLIKQRFNVLPSILEKVHSRSALGRAPESAAEFLAVGDQKMPGQKWTLNTELVSRSIWWILFGVKLDDSEIKETVQWSDSAAFFILPQFFHNLICGMLGSKVTKLRRSMVTIMCKRPGVVKLFHQINDQLKAEGGYNNPSFVQTMDEIQFAVNFAGLLGTHQLLQSTLFGLNQKPNLAFVQPNDVVFPPTIAGKDYTATYNEHPVRFLKEVARIDPPVTSANCMTQKPMTVKQSPCLFGGKVDVPVGFGNQYLLSLANRDENEFVNHKVRKCGFSNSTC
jgi:hypothetical protein